MKQIIYSVNRKYGFVLDMDWIHIGYVSTKYGFCRYPAKSQKLLPL